MSSPRGLEVGGIGDIGTEELRLESRVGEGDRARGEGDVGDGGRDGDGEVRGNRNEKRLNGSLDCSGGCRTFRYILKLRSARFACGTYLCEEST